MENQKKPSSPKPAKVVNDPKPKPMEQSNDNPFFEDINSAGQTIRALSFSINPYLIVLGSIILALVIFSFFRSTEDPSKVISTGEFIENVKENKYEKLEFVDTGEVKAYPKSIHIFGTKDAVELPENAKTKSVKGEMVKKIEINELVDKLKNPTFQELVGSVFGGNQPGIVDEVVVFDGMILATQDGVDDVYVVYGKNMSDFEFELAKSNLNQKDLRANISKGEIKTVDVTQQKLEENIASGNYTEIIELSGAYIAMLNPSQIVKEQTDYAPLNTDFVSLLNDEGIKISELSTEIEPIVSSNINWEMVVNIVSMLFVIFLVFSILRGMNGGGKSLMQFGQSKAKMFFGKKPEVTFKDVAGVDSAREELEEVVMFLKDPKKFLKIGARIPKGLLMVGPPGTGKTLLAKAIAGEAGVPFFHTSGSEFEEMLVGAGASRVRDLFAKAKKASPALVFIDEIDAVARKRGTTVQSSSTEQTLNQILVEMDGFEKNTNVIVIAATNRPDVLDPAILRPGRFDRRIVVENPDIKGREAILKIHAKNKPFEKSVDLSVVARRTVGYSGADLENMLNEAAIIVAKDDRSEITMNDIEEAANRTAMGRARNIERTPEELKKTAYHEAGHAIVAKLTPKSDPVHKITIVSRGMALGVTMQLPEKDKYSQSYEEMESRLRVLMAGRAAEEIIYGAKNITSGASNDIEKATQMARRMIKSFGYSKKLGLVKYGQSNELQYLGYGYGEQSDYSPAYAQMIDDEVKRIMDEAYADALDILKKNMNILEKISVDLIEKEVMDAEEFDKYFAK